MGVIEKQTIKGNVYTYLGVVLGFVTTSLLLPRYLSPEQIGLINILIANTLIFAQFGGLGIANITTRMFTYFRDRNNGHNGFLFLSSMISLAGYILVLIAFFILKPQLIGDNGDESVMLSKYINYVAVLIGFKIVFAALDNYYKVLYNAVKGTIMKEFLQRVFVLVSIALFIFQIFDFHQLVIAYIVSYSLPTLLIIISLYRIGELRLKPQPGFLTKELSKSIFSVGLWGIISSAAGIITINIDRLMLNNMIDLDSVGIYTTTFFFGTLISIPSRPLTKISSVVIADAWKNQDVNTIQDIYTKSSLNQFIIGLLILIGVWANIDNVFEILPVEYLDGKYVILIIGIAYLFDMISGNNSAIIVNSKYYRLQTYFMVVFVGLVVVTNFVFIPMWGIIGAAIASAMSKLIFNIIKLVFLQVKFKMQPFDIRFVWVLLLGVGVYLLNLLLPKMDNYIVDIILRSGMVSLIFLSILIILKLSPEMNKLFFSYLKKVINR